MIQAKELRIGNFINVSLNGKNWIKKVSIVGFETLRIVDNGKNIKVEQEWITPIPLTEDILLKCGFDSDMILATREGELRYYGNGRMDIGGYESCTLSMVFISECNYLHQLQNLYFALTGKDLEVEL